MAVLPIVAPLFHVVLRGMTKTIVDVIGFNCMLDVQKIRTVALIILQKVYILYFLFYKMLISIQRKSSLSLSS